MHEITHYTFVIYQPHVFLAGMQIFRQMRWKSLNFMSPFNKPLFDLCYINLFRNSAQPLSTLSKHSGKFNESKYMKDPYNLPSCQGNVYPQSLSSWNVDCVKFLAQNTAVCTTC